MTRRVVQLHRKATQLRTAIDAFLSQPDLAPSSRRSYAQTIRRLVEATAPDRGV